MELLYTAHIPAGDGPFPAIVVLHGWGDSAHGLIGFAPLLDGGRSIFLTSTYRSVEVLCIDEERVLERAREMLKQPLASRRQLR